MMKTSRFSSLIIYTDGSLTPKGAGAGVVVMDVRGELVHLENRPLDMATNNEAEYGALLLALEVAGRLEADVVEIRADSEVMVNQMCGNFTVNSNSLKQIHWQACQLARQFPRVRYFYVPRDVNVLADALATEASAGRMWKIGVA